MTRRKEPPTSAALAAQIARLEEARQRAEAAEDQRRGALLREYLEGPRGAELRVLLGGLVAARDRRLFALDPGAEDPR